MADLHDDLAPFYSHTGRPSIDPELMIRTLMVGYCYGIRSERRLCEEIGLNLAYRLAPESRHQKSYVHFGGLAQIPAEFSAAKLTPVRPGDFVSK